jgi:hypothetical protein
VSEPHGIVQPFLGHYTSSELAMETASYLPSARSY